MDTAAAPTPTIPSANRGAGPAAARTTAGARDPTGGPETGGGFAAELRRAAEEPAKDGPPTAAAPRPDPPAADPAAPPSQPSAAPFPDATAIQLASCTGAAPPPEANLPASAPGVPAPPADVPPEVAEEAPPGAAVDALPAPEQVSFPAAAPAPSQEGTVAPVGGGPAAAAARGAARQADAGPTVVQHGAEHDSAAAATADAGSPARPVPLQGALDTAPDAQPARGSAEAQQPSAERPSLLPAAPSAPEATAQGAAAPAPCAATQTAAEPPPPVAPAPRAPPPPPARQVAPIAIALALGTGGAPRLTVALEPEELGRVEIRVERGAEGEAATVRVVAERPETLALLQRDARQLDRALQGAGIALAEGAMQFSLAGREQGAAGGDGAKNNGDGGQARRDRAAAPDALSQQPAPPPRAAAGLALLDIAI